MSEPVVTNSPPDRASAYARAGWMLVLLLAIVIPLLRLAPLRQSYESALLLLILNFTLTTVVAIFIAALAGRSFLARGEPSLLMLCCAMLIWGTSALLAAAGNHVGNYNITIHNLGMLLSSACHAAGAVVTWRYSPVLRQRGEWLALGCVVSLFAVGAIWLATLEGWLPVFFIEAQGGTAVRTFVLLLSLLMLGVASLLLGLSTSQHASFSRWYSIGLAAVAVGSVGLMLQVVHGSVLGWTSRAAQYLGGLYMLAGAIVATRTSHSWELELSDALKEARDALLESEQRFRLVANSIPQLAWMARPDGSVFWYNQRWYEYTGTTLKQMQGWGWESVHDPDELPRVLESWTAAYISGDPWEATFPIRRHDGVMRWHLSRAMPLRNDAGEIIFWFGTNTDIQEQRETARRLEQQARELAALVDAVPAIVWRSHDSQGRNVTGNRVSHEFLHTPPGFNPFDPIGSAPNFVVYQEGRRLQDHELPVQRAAREGVELYNQRLQIEFSGGVSKHVFGHAVPLLDAAGKSTGAVAAFVDMTALVQAEADKQQLLESERAARAESERVNRMKDEFLSTLSHELRTPLNAILGWSQILARNVNHDRDWKRGLEVIERNARLQTTIIEDLLDMSRIISGKVRLEVQRVELPAAIEGAVQSLRPSADAKEIQIDTAIDPRALPITGDPTRLQQVVWNLLSNAIKFTPKGGRVRVSLQRTDDHVEIAVSDNGQGIRPEFLPHVFDRFRQQDSTTTRRHGGLGLGLALVKHLVELHGGSVRARSAGEHQGATFTITLPVPRFDAGQAENLPPAHRADTPLDAHDLRGITVIVVDDEPDALSVLQRVLEECDAIVIPCASAAAALAALDRLQAQVLVSDIGMPERDGYELMREVRHRPPEKGGRIPAIALTAFARPEDRRRVLASGFDLHLPKPVEPTDLIAAVSRLTSTRPTLRVAGA